MILSRVQIQNYLMFKMTNNSISDIQILQINQISDFQIGPDFLLINMGPDFLLVNTDLGLLTVSMALLVAFLSPFHNLPPDEPPDLVGDFNDNP